MEANSPQDEDGSPQPLREDNGSTTSESPAYEGLTHEETELLDWFDEVYRSMRRPTKVRNLKISTEGTQNADSQ